ncbi:MAG: citrate synthase [Sulfuricurvum sp.]|uniref:citrate synthase n=1 Tax=Sulfuricurvum sp. TaxID=2025608 RepID=UPI00271F9B4D|nr:citrate synthase [Sulfuricurvum sp.]MDO9056806.1 citrate synthase [Sulfuricurvum sp.]
MDTVTLTDNRTGKSYEFSILHPTLGPDVIDVRSLYKETGMFTYDPGFTSTASCSSSITYIDGEKGELLYRGYNISDLATKKSYLDVAYLLLVGKLPNEKERAEFDIELRKRSFVHEGLKRLFDAFPDKAHPMAMMSSAVSALSTFYFEHLNVTTADEAQIMARRIIAKIPTLAAFTHRRMFGIPYIYPDIERPFTENFLYMMRAYPGENLEIRDVEVKALDTIFTLHSDHEQNASTSTVRAVASTGAHPYASLSAGINALWGRAHGGANESVIAQLEFIGSVDNVDEFIARAKDPNDEFKLMGFGHRVYKNFDPRAKILKNLLDQLKDELGVNNDLLKIAEKIEQIALADEYFIQRKLYPNIDFYSGLILTALKIPKSMFTIIFVIGRSVGWVTQWIELKNDPEMKIARPRQRYVGEAKKGL